MIILVLLFPVYLVALALLCKTVDLISKAPKKYDAIPGFDMYRESIWYSKTRGVDNCGFVCGIYYLLALFPFLLTDFLFWLLISYKHIAIYFKDNDVWNFIEMVYVLIYCLVVSFYLPAYSKKPAAIRFSIYNIYNGKSRSFVLKNRTKLLIVMTLVLFPMRLFGLLHMGVADDDEIIYRPFWGITTQQYRFSEIVDTVKEYNENGNIEHYYLINEHGQCFDLYGSYYDLTNLTSNDTSDRIRYNWINYLLKAEDAP